MLDGAKLKCTQGEMIDHVITSEGGSSAITKLHGPGVAVTRTGTGAYLLTWSENPGTWHGNTYGLAAATPGNLAGHTVIFGEYNSSAYTLAFVVYNGSDSAHDLAADEYVTTRISFSQITV
jgi:hypothetical protein